MLELSALSECQAVQVVVCPSAQLAALLSLADLSIVERPKRQPHQRVRKVHARFRQEPRASTKASEEHISAAPLVGRQCLSIEHGSAHLLVKSTKIIKLVATPAGPLQRLVGTKVIRISLAFRGSPAFLPLSEGLTKSYINKSRQRLRLMVSEV